MSIIQAQHNCTTHFEVVYRNHSIVSIRRYTDTYLSGETVEYDDLSLSERESILLAIIEHLKQQ